MLLKKLEDRLSQIEREIEDLQDERESLIREIKAERIKASGVKQLEIPF